MTKISSSSGPRNADGEREIASFERNAGERLRVAICVYRGVAGVDIRVMVRADDGSWRPTKAGARIRPHHLDDIIGALTAARDHLKNGEPC